MKKIIMISVLALIGMGLFVEAKLQEKAKITTQRAQAAWRAWREAPRSGGFKEAKREYKAMKQPGYREAQLKIREAEKERKRQQQAGQKRWRGLKRPWRPLKRKQPLKQLTPEEYETFSSSL